MKNVFVAVGVCLLSVVNATAQWTGTSTSDPTTRTGSVGIGTGVTTPAAPLDVSTGTFQAWINLASSNALPPKVNFMQSAAAAVDLGIGSVNFTNAVGTVVSQISARYPGTDQSQSYMRFSTSGLERLRIDSAGNVGIGTTIPVAPLDISTGVNQAWVNLASTNAFPPKLQLMQTATAALDLGIGSINFANGLGAVVSQITARYPGTDQSQSYMRFTTSGLERLRIDSAGNVGIGTTVTGQMLTVGGVIESTVGVKFPDGNIQTAAYPFSTGSNTADLNRPVLGGALTSSVTNSSTTGSAVLAAVAGNGTTSSSTAYLRLSTSETTPKDWRVGMTDGTGIFKIRDNSGGFDRMTISGATINFNGNVTGTTIQATYQDLAEWVPAGGSMPSGTVVVLSDDVSNTVTASTHAYDTGVAGVVSPAPGLLLGVEGPSKAKIATTGRVRVRVDATKVPIRRGDLLVTSDRLGMAMKSEPLDLGGVKIHRPGTLIGKALEPLPSGEGEILVLLSLQ